MSDYLALCLIGAGSSYGRAPDKQKAIDLCKKAVEQDWSTLFDLDGKECSINVFDVDGHDSVRWDHQGVHGDNPEGIIPRLELVTVTLSVKKRRGRR